MVRKNKKGFSLVEVIVVISIITVGLVGVAALVFQNLQIQNLNERYLVASMLAQEGIELVRNIRDDNWLNQSNDWLVDITEDDEGFPLDGTFIIDYRGRASINHSADDMTNNDTKLYLENNGHYSHVYTGANTAYRRLITVSENVDYLMVTSEVRWKKGPDDYSYKIFTVLYNWRG